MLKPWQRGMAKFFSKAINDSQSNEQVLLLEDADPEDQKPSSAVPSDAAPEIIITEENNEGLTGEPLSQIAAAVTTSPRSEKNWQLVSEPIDYDGTEGGRGRCGTYDVQDEVPPTAKKQKKSPNCSC